MKLLPKKYKIKVNMYINQIVCYGIKGSLNNKNVVIDVDKINPSGEDVVNFILSKTGLAGKFNPYSWKKEFLADVNSTEKKGYDTNMKLDEFLEVLIKEKVVTLIEIKEEEEKKIVITPSKKLPSKQMSLF